MKVPHQKRKKSICEKSSKKKRNLKKNLLEKNVKNETDKRIKWGKVNGLAVLNVQYIIGAILMQCVIRAACRIDDVGGGAAE